MYQNWNLSKQNNSINFTPIFQGPSKICVALCVEPVSEVENAVLFAVQLKSPVTSQAETLPGVHRLNTVFFREVGRK